MKKYRLKVLKSEQAPPPQFTLNYETELNQEQLRVVTSFDGPILVVAGAGSGKTRTLTYRVARMIESGIAPESILLLTFTRKAAREMLRRASSLLDARCEQVAGGTFHSFANLTLRRYGKAIGVEPGFSILDQGDSQDVVGLLLDQSGLKQSGRSFPKKGTIHTIFSKSLNKGISIKDVVLKSYPRYFQEIEALDKLHIQFSRYKIAHQLLDYDDLLLFMQRLLEEQPDIRQRLSTRYQFIMVDEYQDTNKIQARIVRLLAATHNNVMAVGDESQSIYAFRGANYRNILEFPEQFPDTTIIKLEENFRSVQPILDITNEIIQQARESFQKRLYTKQIGGSTPILVPALNESQQSQFVAQRIFELWQEEGVALTDIAVLFRSGFHSFDLELELNRRGIPFMKFGGVKFIEAAHIKDLLAHLRVLVNPLDEISWRRILLLLEGIGPKTASKLIQQLQPEGDPFGWLAEFPKKTKYCLALQRLGSTLRDILPLQPGEQVQSLREYYAPILQNAYDDFSKREPDLEQLNVITEQFTDLEKFLTEMTLEPPNRSVDNIAQIDEQDDELLTLSTIHSAKGLEWRNVFVIWLAEGRFPSVYSLDDDDALEEELRLLYVATTRAMQHLYLSYPVYVSNSWENYFGRPSRFLEGISPNNLEQWSLFEDTDGDPEEEFYEN